MIARRDKKSFRLFALFAAPALMALIGPALSAGATSSTQPSPLDPTWSTLSPPSNPPGLHDAAAVYDPANQTVVFFGGEKADNSLSGATWVWNGSGWSDPQSPFPGPPARQQESIAFDDKLNQLILFGGRASDGSVLSDTWAWNGQSWVSQVAAAGAPVPPARLGASLAQDPTGDLVLFGGSGASASSAIGIASTATASTPVSSAAVDALINFNDTWQWDGTSWAQATPSTTPPARAGAALIWDPATSTTVLFGGSPAPLGSTAAAPLADTWTWDGNTWSALTPATAPPARLQPVGDFAAALGGVVITGGAAATGPIDDAWTWDGTTWTALAAAGASDRQGAAGAWDGASQQLVVFGGTDDKGGTLTDTVVLSAAPPVIATPTPVVAPTSGVSPPTGGASSTTLTTRPGSTTSVTAVVHAPTATSTTVVVDHPSSTPTTAAAAKSGVLLPPATPAPVVAGTSPRLPLASPAAVPPATQTVHGGSLVTLAGAGFRPGSVVVITFHSTPYTVGRAIADAQGDFTATVAVPTGASLGSHHLVAAGINPRGRATSLVTPIRVVEMLVARASGGPISTSTTMVLIAVGLPIATWFVLAVRSRRQVRSVASQA